MATTKRSLVSEADIVPCTPLLSQNYVHATMPVPAWPTSLGVFGAIAGVVLAAIWTLVMLRLRPAQVSKASEAYAWEGDEASHALY